jgi:hypothetical protein
MDPACARPLKNMGDQFAHIGQNFEMMTKLICADIEKVKARGVLSIGIDAGHNAKRMGSMHSDFRWHIFISK